MSGPFREAFVELSSEAFAIAKAIGEQAVKKAEELQKLHAPAQSKRLGLDYIGPRVAQRYQWTFIETRRSQSRDDATWIVRLKCGHHHVVSLPDRLQLARSLSDGFEYLLDHLDEHAHERSCFCVQYQRFCASCSRDITDGKRIQRTPTWRGNEPSVLVTCDESDCKAWALQFRHVQREARRQ